MAGIMVSMCSLYAKDIEGSDTQLVAYMRKRRI
jgi:hypothetical protein